jgi:hypothetical protein
MVLAKQHLQKALNSLTPPKEIETGEKNNENANLMM